MVNGRGQVNKQGNRIPGIYQLSWSTVLIEFSAILIFQFFFNCPDVLLSRMSVREAFIQMVKETQGRESSILFFFYKSSKNVIYYDTLWKNVPRNRFERSDCRELLRLALSFHATSTPRLCPSARSVPTRSLHRFCNRLVSRVVSFCERCECCTARKASFE